MVPKNHEKNKDTLFTTEMVKQIDQCVQQCLQMFETNQTNVVVVLIIIILN